MGESSSAVPVDLSEDNASPSPSRQAVASTQDAHLFQQIEKCRSESERLHSVGIADLMPVVRQCTLELRQACVTALAAAQASIELVNTRRWKRRGDVEDQNMKTLQEAMTSLSNAILAFKETNRHDLVEPYAKLIRQASSRHEQEMLPLRSLYLSFVFASDLLVVANSSLKITEDIREKMEKRQKNRFWVPKGLRLVGNIIFLRTSKEDSGFGEDATSDPVHDEVDVKYRKKNHFPIGCA